MGDRNRIPWIPLVSPVNHFWHSLRKPSSSFGLTELSGRMMSAFKRSATSSCMSLKAFRKNDVGLQEISNVVLHELEGAFCLRPVEGEAELVEAMIGQVQFPEQPLRNPPAAVVGSQRMIFDHQHVDVRLLDHDLAVGNQNAEVGDGSLRPLLEPFGDQFLVLGVDGIKLSVFGRTAGADETILPAFVAHAHQDLADPGLLVCVQKAARYLHREDANLRMNRE